ncbi:MAG: Do family serine endopeptidase [Bryobacterales bacterium]|nr:Do family serine endopeptidase [Bryobacterales bacterium]
MKLPNSRLLVKMREQKLLSTTLLLLTLSIGIVIGTLINTGVNAQRAGTAAPDATPLSIPKAVQIGNEFSKLAKQLDPSVVNITADYVPKLQEGKNKQKGGDDGDDDSNDLFRRFFGGPGGGGDGSPQAQRREQSGTGFIVDKNGYIVTNHHVVDGVDRIKVKLHGDETEYRARLIGMDRETDLAVIKIDAKRALAPVTIANSEGVQVGDWVVAIGSPFGLEASVTAGIVSAIDRPGIGQQFQRFIQTDAAINPGNSGGPLLNIKGEVVGVNTMIATQSGGSQGIGFALPVNTVVRVYNDIIKDGRVTRGSIGISWAPGTKPETLKALGVDHGVIVSEVTKGGPAEKAGMKGEDIVLGINGQSIRNGDDLVGRVADLPVGSTATLNVDRDGKKMDFTLTIMDRTKVFASDPRVVGEKAVPDTNNGKEEATQVKFGISIRQASEEEKELTPDKHGITVSKVESGSFADDIGLLEKDIIVGINRTPIASVEDIRGVQSKLKPGDAVAFRVVRRLPGGPRGKGAPRTTTMFLSGTLPQN